jgi:hypothetical protein
VPKVTTRGSEATNRQRAIARNSAAIRWHFECIHHWHLQQYLLNENNGQYQMKKTAFEPITAEALVDVVGGINWGKVASEAAWGGATGGAAGAVTGAGKGLTTGIEAAKGAVVGAAGGAVTGGLKSIKDQWAAGSQSQPLLPMTAEVRHSLYS